jgi:hypothetical protein
MLGASVIAGALWTLWSRFAPWIIGVVGLAALLVLMLNFVELQIDAQRES